MINLPHNFKQNGFTLIELLIVVAIIAILAAIAVPNFMEAQVRSKVSRAKSDLRACVTALESYHIDFNSYPPVGDPELAGPWDMYTELNKRLTKLTTPLAYISSLPSDPFYTKRPGPYADQVETLDQSAPLYVYSPGNIFAGGMSTMSTSAERKHLFSIASRAPNQKIDEAWYCMAHPYALRDNGSSKFGQYDPTNGTISRGDIWQTGSAYLGTRNTATVQ